MRRGLFLALALFIVAPATPFRRVPLRGLQGPPSLDVSAMKGKYRKVTISREGIVVEIVTEKLTAGSWRPVEHRRPLGDSFSVTRYEMRSPASK